MKQIFLILIGSLFFLSSYEQTNYDEAIGRGDTLLIQGDYGKAIDLYLAAQAFNPLKKDFVKEKIQKVYTTVETLRKVATRQRDSLDTLSESLKRSNNEIQKKKDSIFSITISNAPYKYTRLIRDGPKDPDKIKTESFDIKLISYCDHLDSLGRIMDSIVAKKDAITIDINEYDNLKEKLYYDNDLYEKIYYCFRSYGLEDSVFRKVDTEKYSFGGSEMNPVTLANGKKFTPVAMAKNADLMFYASDDNYIFVCDQKGTTKTIRDTIAMGARVTALDFDSINRVIYFGTISGDIGFIRYNDTSQRRYQPVYDNENALGSKITALQVFKRDTGNFLLATAIDRKAAVYKIDGNFLKPGNKFSGNFLPPNQDISEINNGGFDVVSGKVMLLIKTKKNDVPVSFSWNPFTYEILATYKNTMRSIDNNYENDFREIFETCKYY